MAVINNGNLGMVRQWQNLFYAERYSHSDLGTHKHRIPDFKLLAEAYGCAGLRCESKQDVDSVIKRAMEINDRPVVIDFVVGEDAQVWPMVPAGTSNDEIMAARIRPLFGTRCERVDGRHTLSVLRKTFQASWRSPGCSPARQHRVPGGADRAPISRMTIVVSVGDQPLSRSQTAQQAGQRDQDR